MKNAPTFLSGCVVGTLVTFSLYLSTVYITQLTNPSALYAQLIREDSGDIDVTTVTVEDEEATSSENFPSPTDVFAGVKSWMESTLVGGDAGAYTSVVHVSPRNYLLPVVYTSAHSMTSTFHAVNSTWGQRTEGWAVALGMKDSNISLAGTDKTHLLLGEKCQDFDANGGPYIGGEELFCLLTAIHDTYIDKYQWFVIVHRSTYVAVNQLVKTLLQFDSSELLYIGQPDGFSVTQMAKFGLVSHEKVCRSNAGIILSRAALKKIVPHLRNCRGLGLSKGLTGATGSGDVELGRCFSRRLGVTCSQSLKVSPSRLFVTNPTNPLNLQDFITYYPIFTFSQMLSVFLSDLTREITAIVNMENSNAKLASSICTQLPSSSLGPGVNSCNYSYTHSHISAPGLNLVNTQPLKLEHVQRWEIVTDNKIYNSEKSNPVRGLPKSVKLEIEFVLNRTLTTLGERGGVSPVRIHNVYLRYSGIIGREYILDFEFSKNMGLSMEKRVSVLLPHLENVFQIESTDYPQVEKTIQFIIPLSGVNTRLYDFLGMYEELCLKNDGIGRCSLNLVVYGEKDSELIGERLKLLQLKYPTAKLKQIISKGKFSRGRALELGVSHLSDNDLIFICDVDMMIERSFLRRCRRNPIRGKRVYYPEFFKYYNMEYVYKFNKMPWGRGINRQHGHWAMYSYGMLCVYKSDYSLVGGFNPNIEGWGGEDVDLASRVLKRKLDILRAPDPALSHRYHDKVCSTDLTPKQFSSCISSRNEDLADRTKLAEYVFYLEEKCENKKWNLWS